MLNRKYSIFSLCVASLVFSVPTFADERMFGVGAIAVSTPYKGADTEVLAVPYFAYYTDNLELDITHIKYRWAVTESIDFSLAGQLRFDGYSASDSEYLTGMQDRDMAFEVGASVSYTNELGQLSLAFFNDVSGAHEGNEVTLSYNKRYFLDKAMLHFETGIAFKTADLVKYYYGVELDEATSTRPAYKPGAATSAFFAMTLTYQLSEKLQLLSALKYETLDKVIKDSPIVSENYAANLIIGLSYSF